MVLGYFTYQYNPISQCTIFLGIAILTRPTSEIFRIVCWDSPQMPQITLVSNEHDNYVVVGMVSKLLKPTSDVLV